MPTERFYRLPEHKRQIISEAAMEEFSSTPYEKASINRIIRNARISRGSFYTYFSDKMDLLKFLVKHEFEGIQQVFSDMFDSTKGDYFAIINGFFEYFVQESQKTTQMLNFLRNVIVRREVLQLLGLAEIPPSPGDMPVDGGPVRWMYENIDRSKFNLKDINDYIPLMKMTAATLVVSVMSYYDYPDQLDTIRENLHASLEILKHGCYKSGEETGGDKV